MSTPQCEMKPCTSDAIIRIALLSLDYKEDTTWLCQPCLAEYFDLLSKGIMQPEKLAAFVAAHT